ncbi:MAG: hypothetical protein LBG98_03005 [Puniceicoccales bacterium]|jgi:hypothetical protein|nr:hypothetical protein [Puniceicoccales bacterium]
MSSLIFSRVARFADAPEGSQRQQDYLANRTEISDEPKINLHSEIEKWP